MQNELDKKWYHLQVLIQKSLENLLSSEERSSLQEELRKSSEARAFYVDYVMVHAVLFTISNEGLNEKSHRIEDILNEDLLRLSEYEKIAPKVEIPEKKLQRELIQKVVYPPREKLKATKFQIFTLAMSAAAILFFALFTQFAPERPYSLEVATLVDQINVQWADPTINFKNGDRLWTNQEPIGLDKGVVNIQYDNGVNILVEAPAKFAVEGSGVYVEYGRLFSRVSKSGLGFMVRTPTTRFIDQGTEFGVQADVDGSVELHVLKGKVQLFSGTNGDAKSSQIVTEKKAVKYNSKSNTINAISIQNYAFVRWANSSMQTVWRGQPYINIADIVGGGNGFGTGKIGDGIAFDGHFTNDAKKYTEFQSRGEYISVIQSDYIDGVFIPDGEFANVVSSLGSKFTDFQDTSGLAIVPILNGTSAQKGSPNYGNLKLNSRGFGTRDNPAVILHPNAGITFDLDKLRADLPPMITIAAFKSQCGISETVLEQGSLKNPKSRFWILLDGKQVFASRGDMSVGIAKYISFPIKDNQRFLTLATTDGGDGTETDWCMFAEPRLVLESINNE